MRILFDHGMPAGLARALPDHAVTTAQAQGWDRLSNGDLLIEAEADGFELLITTDRRIRYQQNLSGRRIALIVLAGSTKWSRIQMHLQDISAAVEGVTPSSYCEVMISF
jgi:predicted nuclease of predicted toxin-antitoxin system